MTRRGVRQADLRAIPTNAHVGSAFLQVQSDGREPAPARRSTGIQIEQVRTGGGATWHEDQLVPITRNGRREDVYWTYSYSPIDDDTAPYGIGGVLVVCTETTQKILAERRQSAARQTQQRQFEQAPGFIIIMAGPEHIVEFVNNAHRELFGSDAWIGKPIREAFPSIAGQGFYEMLDAVLSTGETFSARAAEVRFRKSSQDAEQTRYLDFIYAPTVDESGITGIFCEGFDVTERRHLEDERTLLMRELEHRMKNVMAVVGAIVNQSFRGATSLTDVRTAIGNERPRYFDSIKLDERRDERNRRGSSGPTSDRWHSIPHRWSGRHAFSEGGVVADAGHQ